MFEVNDVLGNVCMIILNTSISTYKCICFSDHYRHKSYINDIQWYKVTTSIIRCVFHNAFFDIVCRLLVVRVIASHYLSICLLLFFR